ncbi:hypothetical protein CDD83_1703 [Cordyceps sp. RAO-2017]|nr:hypothetical protein CDD83_1703 [Cordyceps sp. RAO-2017]
MASDPTCLAMQRTTADGSSLPRGRLSKFGLLPTELRLKIWSCAVEPRITILDDLLHRPRCYPMPPVAQLNAEARNECRRGYEAAGRGSHLHFSRDIVVCDSSLCEPRSAGEGRLLEGVASRVRRAAFWDCFPDDGRVDGLQRYSDYLAACYPAGEGGGRAAVVEPGRLWFPGVRELWIVKVGAVDRSWAPGAGESRPHAARQYRYWVDGHAVETAALDLDEPDTKAVLREGRCARGDCRELNRARPRIVSKGGRA